MLSPWSYNILCLSWMDWWMHCRCQPREDKQLGWSLEGNEWRIWNIFTIQTFFASPHGKDVPCLGWKSLTLSLLLINRWGTCEKKIKAYMSGSQVGCLMQTWTILVLFRAIMDWVNVLFTTLILFFCDTKIIHQIFMLLFYGHTGQWKGHVWHQGLCISYARWIWWVLQF